MTILHATCSSCHKNLAHDADKCSHCGLSQKTENEDHRRALQSIPIFMRWLYGVPLAVLGIALLLMGVYISPDAFHQVSVKNMTDVTTPLIVLGLVATGWWLTRMSYLMILNVKRDLFGPWTLIGAGIFFAGMSIWISISTSSVDPLEGGFALAIPAGILGFARLKRNQQS